MRSSASCEPLDVAARLRHLLAAQAQQAVVGPHLGERAARRARLRELVLVVGEDQVAPAAVHGELAPQELLGHGRALDVPAGPALPPRRGPRDVLVGLLRLPEREVERIALVLARLDAAARLELVGPLAGELAVAGQLAHREVDVAARPRRRGRAAIELADQRDDLGDRLGRQRLVVGPAQAEPVGVGDVVRRSSPAASSADDMPALAGGDDDLVVDVGDVLDQSARAGPPLEVARISIEHDKRSRVADVDAAVDRRSRRRRSRCARRRPGTTSRSSPVSESRSFITPIPSRGGHTFSPADRLGARQRHEHRPELGPARPAGERRAAPAAAASRGAAARPPARAPGLVQPVGVAAPHLGELGQRLRARAARARLPPGRRPRPGCARRAAPAPSPRTVSRGVPGGQPRQRPAGELVGGSAEMNPAESDRSRPDRAAPRRARCARVEPLDQLRQR